MAVPEISVSELKSLRDSGQPLFLLDVRSKDEYDFANIDADKLVPLNDLGESIAEMSEHKNDRVVVMCRSGARSAQACSFLMQNGFSNVANLRGGIRAWSSEIDPSIPMY